MPKGKLRSFHGRPAGGLHIKVSAARFFRDTSGATAVEYGLLLVVIAVAALAAIGTLSGKMDTLFTTVAGKLTIS